MKTIFPTLTFAPVWRRLVLEQCFLFLLICLPLGLFAQEPPEPKSSEEMEITQPIVEPEPKDSNYVYDVADEPAEFPGGMTAMRIYLSENLKYPQEAYELGIQGKCYLRFTVLSTGKISNLVILRGVPDCPECDQEAKRLMKNMPDWIPGKMNGKPVNSTYQMPLTFHLY